MFKFYLVFLLSLTPFSALAHSPLVSLLPQDGAYLTEAPSKIEMVFKSQTKIIKVKMHKTTANSPRSLFEDLFSGSDGEERPLDNDFLMRVAKKHVILLPLLKSGNYSVSWRAMGDDGHVIKGVFSFELTND